MPVHHTSSAWSKSISYVLDLGAILRGDLRRATAGQHVVISMGRYCSVGEGAIIRPPGKVYKGCVELFLEYHALTLDLTVNRAFTFYPVRISDFVNIGPGCIVEAAQIGHGVDIGKGSIIVYPAILHLCL